MGVLRLAVGLAALSALGALLAPSCQLVDPPGDDFDPNGITSLVFYPTSDAPSHIVSVGAYIVYAHGDALFEVPKTGNGGALQIRSFGSPVVALAYDGQHGIAYCTAQGSLDTLDTESFGRVSGTSGVDAGSCASVTIDQDLIGFTQASGDSGAGAILEMALPSGAISDAPPLFTPSDAGTALGNIVLSSLGPSVIGTLPPFVIGGVTGSRSDAGPVGSCRLALMGGIANPRVVALGLPDGGAAVVFRGYADRIEIQAVHDPPLVSDCCKGFVSCAKDGGVDNAIAKPSLASDFVVQGGYVYWADGASVLRTPLTTRTAAIAREVDAASPNETIVTFPEVGATVGEIAVDDAYVFFVVGSRLLRALLPVADGGS